MKKRLSEISWQVTEAEYRQDPALSQSILAKFERGGFNSLPTLFDKDSSPSLTFGSIVDGLITGDRDSFNKRFIISGFPKLKSSQETVVKALFANHGDEHASLSDFTGQELVDAMDECQYQTRWKEETRLRSILEQDCCDYYRLLNASRGKELINQSTYDDAMACVHALRRSKTTYHYFRNDDPDSPIRRYYQLKFKGAIDDVDYRCMLDLIIVDYEHKIIIPCDLKTSSGKEWEFGHSFLKWRYDIQARLYWRLLRDNMDKDDYFRDFELKDFRFIVVNRTSRTPVVWGFPDTRKDGDIVLGGKTLRTPWAIGKELRDYLDNKPPVPHDVSLSRVNNISDWITKNIL